MSVVAGRVRDDGDARLKYSCLSHNTIRGAAGASVLNAELVAERYL
jgi:aspartate-semialdehyde dehydrogenase